jgi:hypothetical protein
VPPLALTRPRRPWLSAPCAQLVQSAAAPTIFAAGVRHGDCLANFPQPAPDAQRGRGLQTLQRLSQRLMAIRSLSALRTTAHRCPQAGHRRLDVRVPDDADLFPPRPGLERLVVRLSPDPRVSRISNRGRHPRATAGPFHTLEAPFSAALTNSGFALVKRSLARTTGQRTGGSATDLLSCDGRKPGGNGFEKAGSIAAESRQLATHVVHLD